MKKNTNKKSSKIRKLVQSTSDTILLCLKKELPEFDICSNYGSRNGTSYYIYIKAPNKAIFGIRISNHNGGAQNKNNYDFDIRVSLNTPFKLCSTVMQIVNDIKNSPKYNIGKMTYVTRERAIELCKVKH